MVEVQSRLQLLYPEYMIAHMPPIGSGGDSSGSASATAGSDDEAGTLDNGTGPSRYHCTSFVANAAVYGNCFQWHVDADPSSFPLGEWTSRYVSSPHSEVLMGGHRVR